MDTPRFTWPPRTPVADHAPPGPQPDARARKPGHPADAGAAADLRQPPSAAGPTARERAHKTAHMPAGRWSHWMHRVERDWLGLARPPAETLLRESAWSRDDAGAYCPRCAGSAGMGEADAEGCAACRDRRLPWTRAIRLGEHGGMLAELILAMKFHRDRTAARALGRRLGQALMATPGFRLDAVIVPVPTSRTHRIARGIDHTAEISRAAGQSAGISVLHALKRRHGPSQLEVPPSAREANVRHMFAPRSLGRTLRPGRKATIDRLGAAPLVVVLDDVRTTGATLRAAARALKPELGPDCELWTASLAVATDPARRAVEGRS